MSDFYIEPMQSANFKLWNQVIFVTLNEFIYLAAGYQPLPAGQHMFGYLNLSNESFKRFYEGLKRLGEELSHQSTEETEVRNALSPEPKYEAIFLVKWAASNNIRVTPYYSPVLSTERKRATLICDTLIRRVVSRNYFAELLSAFNPISEDLFKLRLSDGVRLQEITPISGTQDLDYSIDIEDRNYEY